MFPTSLEKNSYNFPAMITSKVVMVFILFVQNYEFSESVVNIEDCSLYVSSNQYRTLRTIVPSTPISGTHGKYCEHSEKTCCNQEVEATLLDLGKNDFEKVVRKKLTHLSRLLKSKSTKFNEYFKDLLDKSKKDFHEMFKKTYGMVYEQNSYVFSDFFAELEKYFTHGKSNLADVMDTFFNILYQKMFTVMNSQFKFDDKYLGCVSEHMNELKPFGDVPQKLSLPLKRSFIAARVYSQSLNIVGEIVNNLINLIPSENCSNAVTKMLHCSVCKNVPSAKVCQGFCINIMKGCFALHSEIDAEWSTFVDVFHKVQQRLLGPFNLELVVEPINVKISEAIMNFQENANHVSTKVFNGCGKPPLLDSRRRRRRQANSHKKTNQNNDMRNNEDSRDNNERRQTKESKNSNSNRNRNNKGRRKGGKGDDHSNPNKSSPIDGFLKFIQEIGEHVLPTKYFWKRLPFHVCSEDMNIEKNRSAICWNGHAMGKYDIPEVQDGLKNQEFNQEVPTDPKRQSAIINEQIYTLKSVTMALKNAYNGQDVEWIDSDESFESGSGSGMEPDPDNFGSIDPTEGSGSVTSIFESGDLPDFPHQKTTSTEGSAEVYDYSPSNRTDNVSFVPVETTSYIDSVSSTSGIDSTTISTNYNISSTTKHNVTTSDGTTIRYEKMSLNQAVATYLLPTVVVWIGGSFNEWFHTFVCNFQF